MAPLNRFAYVLVELAALGPISDHLAARLQDAADSLGVRLWGTQIQSGRANHAPSRLFFCFDDYRRDDDEAERVAEAIVMLTELFHGPTCALTWNRFSAPFRIDQRLLASRSMSETTLAKRVEALLDHRALPLAEDLLGSTVAVDQSSLAIALKACPSVLRQQKLRFATAFFFLAQREFWVAPPEIRDSLDDGRRSPVLASELARWESSFQSCYKAVEAIIGDPPKDKSRYLAKLRDSGIDPDEQVGYRQKADIGSVIRKMNDLRDSRAAHGSTPRGLMLADMIEYQACAQYVVTVAIQKAMGESLFDQ